MKKVTFINPKGGVGKSTLALLASITLASRFTHSQVLMLDLDNQGTSSRALKRFENNRLRIYGSSEFMGESGAPYKSTITSFVSEISSNEDQFLVIDTPAGVSARDHPFLSVCDYIFVPTSCSDADLSATYEFLDQLDSDGLFVHTRTTQKPHVVLLPNQIISKNDISEVRIAFDNFPALFGKPLPYSIQMRKAFKPDADDKALKELLKSTRGYFDWMTTLIAGDLRLPEKIDRLYQL